MSLTFCRMAVITFILKSHKITKKKIHYTGILYLLVKHYKCLNTVCSAANLCGRCNIESLDNCT